MLARQIGVACVTGKIPKREGKAQQFRAAFRNEVQGALMRRAAGCERDQVSEAEGKENGRPPLKEDAATDQRAPYEARARRANAHDFNRDRKGES